jgi:hypothetical protein
LSVIVKFAGLPLHDRESGQREGERINAGPEIDDAVAAGTVGDGGPRLLDQDRTSRLDRDAGQHGARGVLDDPGERALGVSGGWSEDE